MIRQRVKAGLKQRRIRSKALLTIGAAYRGHDEITDAVRALLCGAATLFRDRECDVTAQLVVGDSKNTITLARSSADVSPFVDQLNSVPSTHMRCRMTASLRATATLALRSPLRLASLIPQAFSADHFGTRVSSTLAASNRYVRSKASPHFEIRPDQSASPEA